MAIAAGGSVVGLLGALAGTRLVSTALHAVRVDPVKALRAE